MINIKYKNNLFNKIISNFRKCSRGREQIVNSLYLLMKLPIKELKDKNCACFLWVMDSHLDKGIEVLRAWELRCVTITFV